MRQLGIPTVVDRLVQQAIMQVLEPLLDPTFSETAVVRDPYARWCERALREGCLYSISLVHAAKSWMVRLRGP
jgi:hypothetical protein